MVITDSKLVVLYEERIRIFLSATGALLHSSCVHSKPMLTMSMVPDCENVLTQNGDANVKIFSVNKGICLLTLADNTDSVVAIAPSESGRTTELHSICQVFDLHLQWSRKHHRSYPASVRGTVRTVFRSAVVRTVRTVFRSAVFRSTYRMTSCTWC